MWIIAAEWNLMFIRVGPKQKHVKKKMKRPVVFKKQWQKSFCQSGKTCLYFSSNHGDLLLFYLPCFLLELGGRGWQTVMQTGSINYLSLGFNTSYYKTLTIQQTGAKDSKHQINIFKTDLLCLSLRKLGRLAFGYCFQFRLFFPPVIQSLLLFNMLIPYISLFQLWLIFL